MQSSSSSTGRSVLSEVSTLQHYDSAPDLRAIKTNVTERKKRKLEASDSTVSYELKNMFQALSEEQNKHFTELQATVNNLKEQNEVLTKSVETMSSKYDEFLNKITKLEKERKEDKKVIHYLEEKIELLEDKIENFERGQKSSGIEIRNMPIQKQETKDDLSKLVIDLGKAIKVDIQTSNIRDIFRIKGKSGTINPIIVDFASVITKEKYVLGVKKYNKLHDDNKLSTAALQMEGPVKPIYVAESLTAKTRRLFFLARDFCNTNDYDYCWTSHGRVYLRKKEGTPAVRLVHESELMELAPK